MVRLFNICRNAYRISCDYEPEKSNLIGHVIMDSNTFKLIDIKYSQYECGEKMYVAQVRAKLEEIVKQNESIPEETFVVWF